MTVTPQTPVPTPETAISLADAKAVMLLDGTWVQIEPGSLFPVINPSFTDPNTRQQVAPGDFWFQFQGTADPTVVYAFPIRSIAAVQFMLPS
jgi:hypothetical protein